MIAALAITLTILPATKPDTALRCTDPQHATPYRVAAEYLDHPIPTIGEQLTGAPHGNGVYEVIPRTSWVFVVRSDATCIEAADHQSHWSEYWGARHTHRDHMP